MEKIIVNCKNNLDKGENLKKASSLFLSVLRTNRGTFSPYLRISFENPEGSPIDRAYLSDDSLYLELTARGIKPQSELIFALLLLEQGLEAEAGNIAWEILKLAQSVKVSNQLFKDHLFGLDILYVTARKYPQYTRFFSAYFQEEWNAQEYPDFFNLFHDLTDKNGWDDNFLSAYLDSCQKVRKDMADYRFGLKKYISSDDNLKTFMGYIAYKYRTNLGMNQNNREEVIAAFEDGDISISHDEVDESFFGIKRKPQLKVSLREKKIAKKSILLTLDIDAPKDTKANITITHPHMDIDDYDFDSKGLKNFKKGITLTSWTMPLTKEAIISFPYSAKGEYLVKITYEDQEIFSETIYINTGREQKVEVLESGSIENGSFIPFDRSNKSFGIKFKLYNGKGIGEIYHPNLKITNPFGGWFERSISKIFYNNSGVYTIKFEPDKCLEFSGGEFYFTLWNEDRTEKLFEQKFDFNHEKHELKSPVKKILDFFKKEETEYQKAWVKSYGVFGFAKDYIENINISLTTPKLNKKASIGSYIGCTYLLNDKVFKQNQKTLNIFVKVKVLDDKGNTVLKDKWADTAFKSRDNAACFRVEEGELFEGHWIFTITHSGKELFSQTIPVMI